MDTHDEQISPNESATQTEDNVVTATSKYMPMYSDESVREWLHAIDGWLNRQNITNDFIRYSIIAAAPHDEITIELHEATCELPEGSLYDHARNALPELVAAYTQPFATPPISPDEQPATPPSTEQNVPVQQIVESAQAQVIAENEFVPPAIATNSMQQLVDAEHRNFTTAVPRLITELQSSQNANESSQQIVVNAPTTTANQQDNEVLLFRRQLAAMREQLHQLEAARRPANQTAVENPPACWFHATYGNAAKKCRPPCNHRRNATQ